nr:MAG TPA: hypothetical protein [Caudoviricetes sp.]
MRSIPEKLVCGLDCAEIADSVSRDLYVAVLVTGDDRIAKLLLNCERVDVMLEGFRHIDLSVPVLIRRGIFRKLPECICKRSWFLPLPACYDCHDFAVQPVFECCKEDVSVVELGENVVCHDVFSFVPLRRSFFCFFGELFLLSPFDTYIIPYCSQYVNRFCESF